MQATKTPDGMVSLQSIYDVICTRYQNKKEDSYDGLLRLLRKKYAFLQKHLLMCDKEEFKVKGNNFVPVNDAPIVRDLLLEALSTEESNPTRDWFLGKVDTSVSEQALVLYMHMKCVIKNSYLLGETDQVTCDEWLNTVSASINHNTARNTLDLKRSLERFRNDSLALDMNVAVGDITASDEFGNRAYILKGQRSAPDITGKTIEEILECVQSQDDYFSVLAQILARFEVHAKKRVMENIEFYAEAKSTFNLEKADDAVPSDSIASEYAIWFQRIHEYLSQNPDVCREIEKKTGADNLTEFFRMKGR